jgi:hypothetical protein
VGRRPAQPWRPGRRPRAPQTWSTIGLDRDAVAPRGLILRTLPVVVRRYATDSGYWWPIHDEKDGRFGLGAAVPLEHRQGERPLKLGDVVLYLEEAADRASSRLWAPSLVVALSPDGSGRRTAWTLTDVREFGRGAKSLDAFPNDVQTVTEDLARSMLPADPNQRRMLLDAFDVVEFGATRRHLGMPLTIEDGSPTSA